MGVEYGSNPNRETARLSTSQLRGEPLYGPRIVIVEDNPADVFLEKEALLKHGILGDLVVLQDGEAGFEFIHEIDEGRIQAPDVFILDLSLPRRNGPELLEFIKRSRMCSRACVLIASSSHNPRDKAQVVEQGADRYFVKPSSFEDFMKIGEIVSDLLAGRCG
jgi:chemotaxis family two-component system response regulator Rcp1